MARVVKTGPVFGLSAPSQAKYVAFYISTALRPGNAPSDGESRRPASDASDASVDFLLLFACRDGAPGMLFDRRRKG